MNNKSLLPILSKKKKSFFKITNLDWVDTLAAARSGPSFNIHNSTPIELTFNKIWGGGVIIIIRGWQYPYKPSTDLKHFIDEKGH